MLAEYLHHDASAESSCLSTVPGVRAFRLHLPASLCDLPAALPLQLNSGHLEIFFCFSGTLVISRQKASPLAVSAQKIFLLSDCSSLSSAHVTSPLNGILLDFDLPNFRPTLEHFQLLLGDLSPYLRKIQHHMQNCGGCLLHSSSWSHMTFSIVESLPAEEQPRACLMKTTELFYLLCHGNPLADNESEEPFCDSYLTHTITQMHDYMEQHLDEKLTIETMSRLFHISPTAFKSHFQRIYGQPVHTWLQSFRIRHAAGLLHSSPLSILQIAQAVGYEGVSQFNVLFKRSYGMTPHQYRKISNTGEF